MRNSTKLALVQTALAGALMLLGCASGGANQGGGRSTNHPATIVFEWTLAVTTVLGVVCVILAVASFLWGKSSRVNPLLLALAGVTTVIGSQIWARYEWLMELIAIGAILLGVTWEVVSHWKDWRKKLPGFVEQA